MRLDEFPEANMRYAATWAVVGILAIPPILRADSADDAKTRQLVEQLASDDYRTRELANRQLLALGDRALPALQAILPKTTDPEASRRLEVIVRKLETDRLVSARPITIRGKNMTLLTALGELEKQSGYKFREDDLSEENKKSLYSFDLVAVPFWKALDTVCDAAGLSANIQEENARIYLYYSDTYNPFVAYSGMFRIVASNINVSQGLQLGGLQRARPFARQPEYLSISFQVMSEPKAPLVGIGQPEVLAATDDTGASMLAPADPNQQRAYYPPQQSYRTYNMGSGMNLTRVGRNANTIKEMRAVVPVMILSNTKPEVTIPNLQTAKGKRHNGREVDVEITQFAEQNGVSIIGVLITRRDGNPDDYAWLNGITQRIEVYDDKGEKIPLNSIDQNTSGPNVTAMTLQFSGQFGNKKIGKATKLVYVEWETITKNLEFTFKGIPLP